MDLAQEAQDAAAAAAAAWARDRPAASSREAAAGNHDECHAVIRIDHMNDSSGTSRNCRGGARNWDSPRGCSTRSPGGGAGFLGGWRRRRSLGGAFAVPDRSVLLREVAWKVCSSSWAGTATACRRF